MGDESSRRRRDRKRDPDSITYCANSILIEFTDKMPVPGTPEYLEFQERLERRNMERAADTPFIIDESDRGGEPPGA